MRTFLMVAVVTVASLALSAAPSSAAAGDAANDHTVLILGPTVTGGASSREAAAAVANGMDVEIVDSAGWAAKTASNFGTYRALILGDPTCRFTGPEAAAIANASVWSPAVNGRVIIIGSDPVYHYSSGGNAYTAGGVKFASGETTKTGAYITLSCYQSGAPANTPVPVLQGFGSFTVTGVPCASAVHIVATHPALSGITDSTLSNWGCSVHEAFDSWPTAGFDVLAIAKDVGNAYTASDGTVGTPYILARGATVISDITLTPTAGSASTGSSYTLTATVTGQEVNADILVTFTVLAGPNTGLTLTGTTNSSGQATATYTSAAAGTDTWVARFTRFERTQTSNRATVTWTVGAKTAPPSNRAQVIATSPKCGQVVIDASGVTPGLPHQIVVTPYGGGTSQTADVTAGADQKVTATFTTGGGTFTAYVRNKSNQVTVSNTEIFTVAACPAVVTTPTPTPTPVRTPTPQATPTPTPIAQLPSTTTGADGGLPIALAVIALALAAMAWRKRTSRT